MTDRSDSSRHTHSTHGSYAAFSAPEELAKRFDAPDRDDWQKPEQVIDHFGLTPNSTVLELGSGTGYFSVRVAKRLSQGKLICLDDEPKMVEYLRERSHSAGLKNLDARPVWRNDVINLSEEIDLLFSVDVYHHLRDRVGFFAALASGHKT